MSDNQRLLQVLCATIVAWAYRGFTFAILVMLILLALAPWKNES